MSNSEKQVLYVKAMTDNDNKTKVSFGEMCHRIWIAKITWFVAMGATFLACLLGIQYGYTKNKQIYTADGSVNFPGATEALYPNGTAFNASDLISAKNLNKVVDSNDEFTGIDITKMIKDAGVSISKDTNPNYVVKTTTSSTSTTDTTSGNYAKYNNHFTITVKAKYFSGSDQARDFVAAIYNLPIQNAVSQYSAMTFASNLNYSKNTEISLNDQLNYLSAQYDYLLSSYKTLATTYADQYLTINDVTQSISSYENSLIANYAQLKVDELVNTINVNGYLRLAATATADEIASAKASLNNQKTTMVNSVTNLQSQLKAQKETFQAIYGTSPTINASNIDLVTAMNELTKKINALIGDGTPENPAIGSELYYLNIKLNNISVTDGTTPWALPETVSTKISNVTYFLTGATEGFSDVIKTVYQNNTYTTYDNGDTIVLASGGIKLVYNLVISVLVGFLVGSLIAYLKGNGDIKKAASSSAKKEIVAEK
ncbi:MAG: hypothetical protein WCR56_02850 [Bacilli bacterium]|jgi:hypothetical protein